MLSIGAFAQIGQVTHRMLRHWDQAGLLVPAHINPVNNYRSYAPEQLDRLHRIVALRQLGFGIEDIASLLRDGVDADQLREMLRRRRAETQEEHRAAAARLTDVRLRLQRIDKEESMLTAEFVKKSLPTVRLAAQTTTVKQQPEIVEFVGPAFDSIAAIVGDTCGALETPIAAYSMRKDGIDVTVGFAYTGEAAPGIEIVTLPAEEMALVTVHLGSVDQIHESWQALHEEIIARGHQPSGPCRELYLRADESGRSDEFVVELQQPVSPAG